jgi:glycosyltransferase involved in cell wall biosynthesis
MTSNKRPAKCKEIFIFICGHNFWEGLFDHANVGFLTNLYKYNLVDFPNVLMTIITPKNLSKGKLELLANKEEELRTLLISYGATITFYHIQGRTIRGVIKAIESIYQSTRSYDKRFIWAQNYFNCFIGTQVKKKLPGTYLHFELLGLPPEEELFYSETNILFRVVTFIVLRILVRINLKHSNSISVVSKRLREYLVSKYHLNHSNIDVKPCLYDDHIFFKSEGLRKEFRQRLRIDNNQKLILYSGMLQKWQNPKLLFGFIKQIQNQDVNQKFKFMILTFDQEKARRYAKKYGIKDLLLETMKGDDLNGVYNAADIGIACRSLDLVSHVSSPVKIPEYLATQNGLILLESIGDYGINLKGKKYALIKMDKNDFLNTTIEEMEKLTRPDDNDLKEIQALYSTQKNIEFIRNLFEKQRKG